MEYLNIHEYNIGQSGQLIVLKRHIRQIIQRHVTVKEVAHVLQLVIVHDQVG